MKKQKRLFAVTYWAYVAEEIIDNLYLLFHATPWSYIHRNAYDLKEEIERADKQNELQ